MRSYYHLLKMTSGKRGFTLVEVIVVVAILSILTSIILPMASKVWERNEETITRGRMLELKRAIIGDQSQYQNGIRMHFGFVGDNGVLPASVSNLVTDPGTYVNWNGPYLVGGFDPAEYNIDSWGVNILYEIHSPPLSVGGLTVVATLRSSGTDATLGTADDINENSDPDLQILASEVSPTAQVQGNVEYVFSSAATVSPGYSFDVYGVYATPGGTSATFSACQALAVGTVEAGLAKSVRQAFFTSLATSLPVGRVDIGSRLFSDGGCSTMVSQTNEVAVFVGDGLSTVSVNMPTLHYVIP